MKLLLTPQVTKRLQRELRKAGDREIGGLLMGEHVGDETFRVVEISVQRSGGSAVCFMRRPEDHQAQLEAFFKRTGSDYTRFNYLGEWHSHPSFDPLPSNVDIRTMQSIVDDPEVGANFLVLMIARLAARHTIEITALAFRAEASPLTVSIGAEAGDHRNPPRGWIRRILGI